MKKYIAIAVCYCIALGCIACDMCNCYLPINPTYNKNLIGLRYRYSSVYGFHHHNDISSHLSTEESLKKSFENYNTYELWGRFYVKPKWQLLFNLPVSSNMKKVDNIVDEHIVGIGDLTLLSLHQIYNTLSIDSSQIRQRILVGGGVKLPSGVYNNKDESGNLNEHLQPGSGSFDILGMVNYMAKYKQIGFTLEATYKCNMTNSNNYKYGNRVNSTMNLFYDIKVGKIDIFPITGIIFETSQYDSSNNVYMSNTGGSALLYSMGCDFYFNQISVNIAYQRKCYQSLNGLQNKNRFIIGLNYSF